MARSGPGAVRRAHGVPSRYFIVCNQFWVHKDHGTALRAFALLRGAPAHADIALVCTGELYDHRAPGHGAAMLRLIGELGIGACVRVLGFIPKTEQIALLKGAIAVVQPTLFEGGPGGGAVYDAIAMGVPALLSDLDVNHEISDPGCRFFARGSHAELAALMAQVAAQPPPRPDRTSLLRAHAARMAGLGAVLDVAIRRAVAAAGPQ